MLLEERQQIIKSRLRQHGRVVAAELAREFGISEDTVRRDLRDLAASGLCRRVHGGALPLSPASGSLRERKRQNPDRKAALGRAAAALVKPGEIVLVDAGSTNLQIVRHLPPDLRLTLVTNAPLIAAEMAGRPHCDLIVLGGRVDGRGGGCIGPRALRDLASLRADLCILGACAASLAMGLTAFDPEEAEFKRQMLEQSDRTLVALENAKLATVAPFGVAPLSAVADLVVEADAPDEELEAFERSGLRLHRAAAPAGPDVVARGSGAGARTPDPRPSGMLGEVHQ